MSRAHLYIGGAVLLGVGVLYLRGKGKLADDCIAAVNAVGAGGATDACISASYGVVASITRGFSLS